MQKHSDAVLQHSNSKRCVAIVNPAGAHGKSKKLWSKLSKVVTDKLTPQGFVVEEVFTSGPDSAARLASEAAAAGAAVVLAVGGDGTIHEVVSGLVHTQQAQHHQGQKQQQATTALAVLPLGTGSDYARTFGWQLNDAVSACQRILDGKVQPTDVSILRQHGQAATLTAEGLKKAVAATTGVDDISPAGDTTATSVQLMDASQPRYVINVASCAVGALSAARAGSLKQFGTLCYPLGGALTLMKWKGCSIQVCMDDNTEWQTLDNLTTLVLGQGRFWGGGLQILPGADPTDGLMDVVALQGLGLWDFISKGHLLRTGQHVKVKGVNVLGRCRRLQVRSAEHGVALPWECDGEPQGAFEAVEVSVLPGALRLLSEKPADTTTQ